MVVAGSLLQLLRLQLLLLQWLGGLPALHLEIAKWVVLLLLQWARPAVQGAALGTAELGCCGQCLYAHDQPQELQPKGVLARTCCSGLQRATNLCGMAGLRSHCLGRPRQRQALEGDIDGVLLGCGRGLTGRVGWQRRIKPAGPIAQSLQCCWVVCREDQFHLFARNKFVYLVLLNTMMFDFCHSESDIKLLTC